MFGEWIHNEIKGPFSPSHTKRSFNEMKRMKKRVGLEIKRSGCCGACQIRERGRPTIAATLTHQPKINW
jgi:hypothetical protein